MTAGDAGAQRAGIGANTRIGMPQEHCPDVGRKAGLQARRGGERRALNGALRDNARNRVRSIPAADRRQRV